MIHEKYSYTMTVYEQRFTRRSDCKRFIFYDENNGSLQTSVKYDLVGAIVDETFLTRRSTIRILMGIQESVFNQFKVSPDEFIYQATKLIKIEFDKLVQQHMVYKDLSY